MVDAITAWTRRGPSGHHSTNPFLFYESTHFLQPEMIHYEGEGDVKEQYGGLYANHYQITINRKNKTEL